MTKSCVGRAHRQIEGKLRGDRKHQQRQQEAQLLAAQPRAEAGADLRADDAADQQHEREHRVDGVVGIGLQHRDVGGDEDDLQQRGARHHRVGMPSM